jgi:hypothetical protein
MGDLSESDHHPHLRHRREGRFEIMAAGRNLFRRRLVGGRQALHGIEDDRAIQPQSVIRVASIFAFRQSEFQKRRVENLARIIAGERTPGPVGAFPSGGEPDNSQPGIGIAENRHRRVPPVRVGRPELLAKSNEPRAERTVARRLRLRDRREVGGTGEGHAPAVGEWPCQAQRSST